MHAIDNAQYVKEVEKVTKGNCVYKQKKGNIVN